MKIWSVYSLADGTLTGVTYSGPDDAFSLASVPSGHGVIEGLYDHLSKRVDLSGEQPLVVDWQPPSPSVNHEWDGNAKRWVLQADIAAQLARRAQALAQIQALEATQHRAMREAALGDTTAKARLLNIEGAIAALREQLS